MKKIIFFSLITLVSCNRSHPDIKKDGGTEITVEASLGDLIKKYIKVDDSIAGATIYETYKEYHHQDKPFIELYLSKLQLADATDKVGTHFRGFGLDTTASASDCKTYFEKKLSESMDTIKMIIEKRIVGFGIAGSTVRKGSIAEQLIIDLPGEHKIDIDKSVIRSFLQSSAKLEFWETYDNKELYQQMNDLNASLSKELYPDLKLDTAAPKPGSKPGTLNEQFEEQDRIKNNKKEYLVKSNPLFSILMPALNYDGSGKVSDLSSGPVVGRANYKDTAKVIKYLNLPSSKKILGPYIKFLWSYKSVDEGEGIYSLIAIRVKKNGLAALSGDIIKDAKKIFDKRNGGAPQISIKMTEDAGWEWEKLTRNNIGKSIAITIDEQVFSYPTVMGEIKGGVSSITGNFTNVEADDFVNVLKAGCFPLNVHIVAENSVPPLGEK